MLVVHLTLYLFPITADFTCHADCDFVLLQQQSDFGYQGNEFKSCTDICLRLAELHGQGLYIVATAVYELLVGVGFLNRGHILTLQVLGNRHFLGCLVWNFHDDSRNFRQFSHEGSTVSAFSEYNLETVVRNRAHTDRLKHSLLTDALGKFRKACLVKVLTWVVVTRLNVCQCYRCDVLLYCLNCCCCHNHKI